MVKKQGMKTWTEFICVAKNTNLLQQKRKAETWSLYD